MTDQPLKPGWRTYRFDQIAINVNDRVEPGDTDLEHYVGLEHLDSDSLKIRRWGSPDDVGATKLRFRAGDIIFGRRRVYQRKLAVAEFDGICSAHAMVLRPKTDVVLTEFLPFFMQSDLFMNRALEISVGSLSPTINWKKLASQEFPLPPLIEQRRIAEVLRSSTSAIDAISDALSASDDLFDSLLRGLMAHDTIGIRAVQTDNLVHPRSWPAVAMEDIAKVERGKFSHRPRNLSHFYGGAYPFVQTGDIAASRGYLRSYSQTLSEEGVQYSRSFPKDTILISIAAVIGATAITEEEVWCTDSVVGIVPNSDLNIRFLEYALRYVRPYLEFQAATQTAQKNINLQILRPLKVPFPNKAIQDRVVEHLDRVEEGALWLARRRQACESYSRSIQNSLFGSH